MRMVGLLGGSLVAAVLAATPVAAEVDLGGTEVTPSTDPAAPTVLEAGTWADELGPAGRPGDTHYVAYRRTMRFSTVHVGVAASGGASGDTVAIEVTTPSGETCEEDRGSAEYDTPFGVFGADVVAGPDDPTDNDAPCLVAEELRIAVTREGGATTEGALPIALRIVEEAQARTPADPTPPSGTPQVSPPDVAAAGETTGATSLAEAPSLEPGSRTTTVAEGEQRLWRVRLGWGQRLSAQVVLEPQDAAAAAVFGDYGYADVDLALVEPTLDAAAGSLEDAVTSGSYRDERVVLVDGTPPVDPLNRFADLAATVPGEYWVAVSVAPPDDGRDAYDVPMTLAVDVVDDPGVAAPRFPDTVQGPTGSAGPDGYDPTTPYLVGPDRFSADVAGTASAPSDAASGSTDDGRRTAGLAVGGASLLCLLAGAVLLVRRRVSRPATR